MDFNGKWVWITGASSGIGAELAVQLAGKGAHLVLSARNLTALHRVAERCRRRRPDRRVEVVELDLLAFDCFQHVHEQVKVICGRSVDVLINNAGVSQRSLALETDLTVERQIMELDFFATITLAKVVLADMLIARRGMLVFVDSVAGKIGSPRRSAYSAAKHALIGYIDALRAEIRGQGVKLVTICPGFVHTPISINALTADGKPLGEMEKATATGLSVDDFVRRMIQVMEKERSEAVIAGGLAILGYLAHRIHPRFYHWVLNWIKAP